jgi:hypothetical protein
VTVQYCKPETCPWSFPNDKFFILLHTCYSPSNLVVKGCRMPASAAGRSEYTGTLRAGVGQPLTTAVDQQANALRGMGGIQTLVNLNSV